MVLLLTPLIQLLVLNLQLLEIHLTPNLSCLILLNRAHHLSVYVCVCVCVCVCEGGREGDLFELNL